MEQQPQVIEYISVMEITVDNRKTFFRRFKKICEGIISLVFWLCIAPCIAALVLFGLTIFALYSAYDVCTE